MTVTPVLALGVAGAGATFLLAISRPPWACILLAAAIPLTVGLGRGTVIPLLRVNEALLIVVAAGVVIRSLPRPGPLPFNGLDLVAAIFCLGGVLIPATVILLTHMNADRQDWMEVVSPAQYLLVYLLYSRVRFSEREVRLLLHLLMACSVLISAVAIAQNFDVAGIRALVQTYYPAEPQPSWDPVYRPASLLGFFSTAAAFCLLNFLLALALAALRHPGFSQLWLTVVMAVNVVGLLVTETYAPLIALPLGAAVVLLITRRIPWGQLLAAPPALAASLVVLWPYLQTRLQQQGLSNGLSLPESIGTRLDYWEGFFLPALLKHGLWLGTGTIIPSEVPQPLNTFVDNGYLDQAFRGGLVEVAAYVLLLATVVAVAWRHRLLESPTRRVVAAVCGAAAASVILVDITSEYLTMSAVAQEFWILVALMTGMALAGRAHPTTVVTTAGAAGSGWPPWTRPHPWRGPPAPRRWPAWLTVPMSLGRRLAPGRMLVQASIVTMVGSGVARLLGFGFQVVSGHLLAPAGFGRLSYALAVASVAAIMASTIPQGLSRFIVREREDRAEQDRYYTSWMAVIAVVVGVSVLCTAVAAPATGLGGWLLVGLVANVVGIAAVVTYQEVQRGGARFTLQSAFLVLANALQLAAIVGLGAIGRASPEAFLLIYGVSGLVALGCFLPLSRRGPRLALAALDWAHVVRIARFVRPMAFYAIFWNVWFSGDLILVQHLAGTTATGIYAAAKAIAAGFMLIPGAVSFVFMAQVARLPVEEIKGNLVRAMAFTTALMVPAAATVFLIAGPLIVALFGARYRAAAPALAILTVGMIVYGLKTVLSSLWLGIGHPIVDTISAAAATVATLVSGLLLIRGLGAVGAALAFSGGALAQLIVAGAVTTWAFRGPTPRISHLGDPPAKEALEKTLWETRPLLLVAPRARAAPDDPSTRLVTELSGALAAHCSVVQHLMPASGRPVSLKRAAGAAAREGPLRAVVLATSRPATVPVLLWALRLRPPARGAPVAVIAAGGLAGGLTPLLRRLGPDLLIVPSAADCERARRIGLNAVQIGDRATFAIRALDAIDDAAILRSRGTRPGSAVTAILAKARRFYVARRDWPRRARWGDRVAYEARQPGGPAVSGPSQPGLCPAPAPCPSDVVGLLSGGPGEAPLARVAALAGLGLVAAGADPGALVYRAMAERWPLVYVRAADLGGRIGPQLPVLARYVHAGGTLFVDGLRPELGGPASELCRQAGVPGALPLATSPRSSFSLPAAGSAFSRELTGYRIEAPAGSTILVADGGWETLADGAAPDHRPLMVRRRTGLGAVVLSAAPSEMGPDLADAFRVGSPGAMPAILSLLLLRSLYGLAAWHPPAPLANFTIDDPALRRGLMGLRWDLLLGQARDHRFHTTIATVPRELGLADPAVVELLRRHPGLLSACYHGCDHDGYEFYAPEAPGTRYRSRPLSAQRRALERAVRLGAEFAETHGQELDRVMVFPYGPGPEAIFEDLRRLGFIATSNFEDKFPPGSARPEDPDLGLRPADLAWAGFPLLWRRSVDDKGYLLDLVLGRPALTFAHLGELGKDFGPFVERAEAINRATAGAALWGGLEDIARHAYLQRRRPDGTWNVLMTGDEACIHNPGSEPRTVSVERPHLPPDAAFDVSGQRRRVPGEVVVPAGGTVLVRMIPGIGAPAPRRLPRCSIGTAPAT